MSAVKSILFLALILLCSIASVRAGELPDPKYTPGDADPYITQDTIHSTICLKGYTLLVRPPSNYTENLKKAQLKSYYKGNCTSTKNCEEDHLISLELGGHPTSEKNLWPQEDFKGKDGCENRLNHLVCSGKMSLKEAQEGIAGNWKEFCSKY